MTHFDFLLKGNPRFGLALSHFLPKENMSVVERYKTRKALHSKLIDLMPDDAPCQIDDIVVESCSPATEILDFSWEGRADLIILAVRDAGPLSGWGLFADTNPTE